MTNNELIYNALKHFEEQHYETESEKWQTKINKLIDKYKAKAKNLGDN